MMHVGDQRDRVAAPPDFVLNLAELIRFGQSRGRDPDNLAAGVGHGNNLRDAAGNIARFFGDHALDNDQMPAADGDGADTDGAGPAARVRNRRLARKRIL